MARHIGPKPPPHPQVWHTDPENWVFFFRTNWPRITKKYNAILGVDLPVADAVKEPRKPRKPYERLNNHWGAKR